MLSFAVMRWILPVLTFLVAARSGHAEMRGVEVFGTVGYMRVGGDEGSPGGLAFYGGAVRTSLARRWDVELDVATGRGEGDNLYPGDRLTFRSTLIAPSLLYVRGTKRLRVYAGGGAGIQRYSSTFQPSPGQAEYKFSESNPMVHARGGVVIATVGRLLVRLEAFAAWRYVLPNRGVGFSVGYRFGRD